MTAPVEALGLINHEAEIAALSAMRSNTEAAIEMVQRLEPSDFYDTRRQVIFEAMSNVLRSYVPIDTPTIVAECIRVAEIRSLSVHVTASDIEALEGNVQRIGMYINQIKRLAWLRSAGEFAFWMVQELQTRPDPTDLFAAAQERWQHMAPASTNNNFVYGWDTQPEHDKIIKQRIADAEAGIDRSLRWPWASWNSFIRPLREGMIGLIAAADGVGKTTYLEQIGEYWAAIGKQVLYVHFEDSRPYKYDRRMSRWSHVPIGLLEDGTITNEHRQQMLEARKRMSQWWDRLHYYDASGSTMHTVVRELESRIREEVCDVVVFDYLDKVWASREQARLYGGDSWERQANDMETLKTFAERQAVPVLTATQGNKSMQDGGIQTRRSIQGSGQKSQKAQLVVIVTRDIVGESGMRDATNNVIAEPGEYSPIVNVRVDKQNRGRTGGFQQFLSGSYFTIRDISK